MREISVFSKFTSFLRNILVLVFHLLFVHVLVSQDAHFSQFYASPLTLNPAIAGTYNGTYRISTIYRDQWRGALDNSLRTFAASGDVKFNLNFGQNSMPDVVGIGITFFGDRVPTFDFNTNQIMLTGAYHKALDRRTKQYIGIGLQGGILQRGINYEDLSFQDQFNSIDGYTLPTGENLPPNNRAFADLGLGLYYTISPTKKSNFHVGLGYFHLTKPNISYYNIPDIINPNVIKNDTLNAKWSFHTGASFEVVDRMFLQPRLNTLIQGPHTELNLGATFRYKISKTEAKYLLLGPYIRGVKNYNNIGIESFIGMAGFEMNNFIIGISYDQNLKNLVSDRRSLSSFELSIIYIGEHSNDENFCPQW